MTTFAETAKEASNRIADGAKFAGERLFDGAKIASDSAKVASKKASTGASRVFDFLLTSAKFLPTLNDTIEKLGLQRKRSRLLASSLSFGAGFAVGAGAGVLFAPKSGQETRKAIRDYFRGTNLETITHDAVDKAEAVAREAAEVVTDAADKAEKVKRNAAEAVTDAADKAEKAVRANGTRLS